MLLFHHVRRQNSYMMNEIWMGDVLHRLTMKIDAKLKVDDYQSLRLTKSHTEIHINFI